MTSLSNIVAALPPPIVAAIAAAAVVIAAVPVRPRPRRENTVATVERSRAQEAFARLVQKRGARRAPTARAVADWCDDIVRHTRSGSSLRDAIATVPTDPATARATETLRLAIDRGATVAAATTRVSGAGSHLGLALSVIATASRVGGPSAAAIDRTATVLRERAADLDDRATHTAQARLSAHVMTAVPILTLALLMTTDEDVRTVVTSTIGMLCLGAGLLLNSVGWWWMRRIIGVPS